MHGTMNYTNVELWNYTTIEQYDNRTVEPWSHAPKPKLNTETIEPQKYRAHRPNDRAGFFYILDGEWCN